MLTRLGIKFLSLFLLLVFVPTHAYAQKILEDIRKPMPKLDPMPQEEFLAQTALYEKVPFGDRALTYKVRIPKDWQEVSDLGVSHYSLSNKLLGEIARFYSPPRLTKSRSRFTIQAIGLEYQLTAEQWLLQYLLMNGYAIQGFKTYNTNRAEALFVLIEGDLTFVVRVAAHINGKRVVLAQHFIPTVNWDEEKMMQENILASFKLTSPDYEFVEEMHDYAFFDVAKLKYPESWVLRDRGQRSIDRMEISLLRINEGMIGYEQEITTLQGRIDLQIVSVFVTDSLEDEIDMLKQDIEQSGVALQRVIEEPDNIFFNEHFEYGKTEVYDAVDSLNNYSNYELWLSVLASGNFYYFITLLTPSRDDDYFVWSRNTQTFMLLLGLIAPQEESLSSD